MTSLPPMYYTCLVIAIIAVLLTITFWVITFTKKITRSTIYNFLLNLSLVAGIHSLGYSLNWVNLISDTKSELYIDNDGLCITQSVISLFSLVGIELWISIMVFRIYYEMSDMINRINCKEFDQEDYIEDNVELIPKISTVSLIICYCIGYGIPLLITIVFGSAGVLGMGSLICWIDSHSGEMWKLALIVIKGGTIVFCLIISILVVKKQVPNEKEKGCCFWKGKKMTILFLPLIQIAGALPSGIYRILVNIDKTYGIIPVLRNIDIICLSSQGIFYPLFFAYICGIYRIIFPPKIEEKSRCNSLALEQF